MQILGGLTRWKGVFSSVLVIQVDKSLAFIINWLTKHLEKYSLIDSYRRRDKCSVSEPNQKGEEVDEERYCPCQEPFTSRGKSREMKPESKQQCKILQRTPVAHARTKHIKMSNKRHHFVCEGLQRGTNNLQYVRFDGIVADILIHWQKK